MTAKQIPNSFKNSTNRIPLNCDFNKLANNLLFLFAVGFEFSLII